MQKTSFPIYISGESIFSNSEKAFQVQNSNNLGEKKESKIIYSPFEAFYLFEKNLAVIIKNNKQLTHEQILKLFSKDKKFYIKYLIFRYLRKKGFLVKTGSKFGEEFRVYESNINNHAKYIVFPIKYNEKLDLKEFIAKNRVSHSTGKKLLLAIVDSEENILFYETDWVKL